MENHDIRSIHLASGLDDKPENLIQHNGSVFYRVSWVRRSLVYITGVGLSALCFYLSLDASHTLQYITYVTGYLFFASARFT